MSCQCLPNSRSFQSEGDQLRKIKESWGLNDVWMQTRPQSRSPLTLPPRPASAASSYASRPPSMPRGRTVERRGMSVAPRERSTVFDWDMIARSSSLSREQERDRRERSQSRTLYVDTYLQDEKVRLNRFTRSSYSMDRLGRSCSRDR